MINDFISAICLCMVVEGLLPFINPQIWKTLMRKAIDKPDAFIRINGLISIILGTIFIYILRN